MAMFPDPGTSLRDISRQGERGIGQMRRDRNQISSAQGRLQSKRMWCSRDSGVL